MKVFSSQEMSVIKEALANPTPWTVTNPMYPNSERDVRDILMVFERWKQVTEGRHHMVITTVDARLNALANMSKEKRMSTSFVAPVQFVPVSEASRATGVPPSTIYNWVNAGLVQRDNSDVVVLVNLTDVRAQMKVYTPHRPHKRPRRAQPVRQQPVPTSLWRSLRNWWAA